MSRRLVERCVQPLWLRTRRKAAAMLRKTLSSLYYRLVWDPHKWYVHSFVATFTAHYPLGEYVEANPAWMDGDGEQVITAFAASLVLSGFFCILNWSIDYNHSLLEGNSHAEGNRDIDSLLLKHRFGWYSVLAILQYDFCRYRYRRWLMGYLLLFTAGIAMTVLFWYWPELAIRHGEQGNNCLMVANCTLMFGYFCARFRPLTSD
jgi:hypothetical protein